MGETSTPWDAHPFYIHTVMTTHETVRRTPLDGSDLQGAGRRV